MAETVWINRNDLSDYLINEDALPILGDGEVRLRIQRFSVTANNVTYAVAGEPFGYWNFFPAQEGFGIVPMWGHAVVEQSNHAEFAEGERVYGYLPMGTHLDVLPEKVSAGSFFDAAAHRLPMSPIYNQYSRLAADPEHDPAKENERMLFAPLFKTGFLIADFMKRQDWFGAEILVMTSASSKTSMGLASCVKNMSPSIKRIGLTSSGNMAFVESSGLYDQVLSYDDLGELPATNAVAVDFAGNAELLKNIHSHFGDALKYSCLVGATHVDARSGGLSGIAGPQPVLFFAPDHAVAAIKERGPKAFGEEVATEWKSFLANVEGTLEIEVSNGVLAAAEAYVKILQNKADPAIGLIIAP